MPTWTYIRGFFLASSRWILGLLAGRDSGRDLIDPPVPVDCPLSQSPYSSHKGSFKASLSSRVSFPNDLGQFSSVGL